MVRPVSLNPTRTEIMMHHLKFALHVAIAMAVINRISFVKVLTSEASTPII